MIGGHWVRFARAPGADKPAAPECITIKFFFIGSFTAQAAQVRSLSRLGLRVEYFPNFSTRTMVNFCFLFEQRQVS
jgi:hypothetical protein